MLKLADLAIRYRWAVIVGVVTVTAVLGWRATKVGLNADFSTYLSQNDPLVMQFNRIGEIFGGNSFGIALVTAEDVFTKENLELVQRLTETFRNVEGINDVTSLTNVVDFRKTDWGMEVGKLLPRGEIPLTPQELATLKSYVVQNDRFEGNLVSKDGTTTVVILRFAGGSDQVINQFATSFRVKAATESVLAREGLPAGTKIFYGGTPFLIFNMTLLITENLVILVPLMLVVLLSVLYLGFRHWAGVVFPLLVVIVSDIWIVGIMGLMGLEFNLLSGIMPVILLALGSADGIHLLKNYFERQRLGDSPRDSARMAFKKMGTPILLTTITTMAGFSSLVISDFSVIKQFGLLTAVGVLLALIVTLTLLPALLSFGVRSRVVAVRKVEDGRVLNGAAAWIYRNRTGVLLGGAAVVVSSIIAIPRIVKDVDWSLCLARGSGPFHAEMLLREKFGGSLPVQVLVEGDLKDPVILREMQTIERRLETIPLVSKSQSIAGILAEMNEVMNDRYVVPQNREGVANLWFLIEGEDMMDQMVARSDREGLLQAKLASWHTRSVVMAVDSIDAFLATLPTRIVVVDLNRTSQSVRSALNRLKRERILRDLRWDLQKHGVTPPDIDLERAVETALNGDIDARVRRSVREEVTAYLLSPQSEVELPPDAIGSVSANIDDILERGSVPGPQSVARIIIGHAPMVDREDAQFLAESLAEVIRVALGEARVAPAVARVVELLPPSMSENERLRRDVKGILWQANENLMGVDADAAMGVLSGGEDDAVVREVEWQFRQTGLPPVLYRMEAELTPTQVESLLVSLFFVIVLLSIIHRSFLGGVLSVVPILMTILVNFAVMGFSGIGLDSFTAMIASIAIGLGIDTDIHFVSRLRGELRTDGDELSALQRTTRTTGVSILINALAVGLGFLVLLAAGGQHIRRFGGLTALTILLSAVFTLTILPSLLFWLKPKFLRLAAEEGRGEMVGEVPLPQPG